MFPLPELPYAYDALQPAMSERTLRFHHDKHHAAYVKTTNSLAETAGDKPQSLEALIAAARRSGQQKLFDNAAQAWNHAFFWNCMTPHRGEPAGDLGEAIGRAFGGRGQFERAFVEAGVGQFGSGWAWLVAERGGALKVVATHDAANPLSEEGLTPLLVCDLWEHAYYLDRQNDRKGFLEAWLGQLAHWRFAQRQLAAARGEGQPWRYPAPEMAHA